MSEQGRVAFLAHLKLIGVDKLADRQLFVNALGRAKRAGAFDKLPARESDMKEM